MNNTFTDRWRQLDWDDIRLRINLSLIHISEPTRRLMASRMTSSA